MHRRFLRQCAAMAVAVISLGACTRAEAALPKPIDITGVAALSLQVSGVWPEIRPAENSLVSFETEAAGIEVEMERDGEEMRLTVQGNKKTDAENRDVPLVCMALPPEICEKLSIEAVRSGLLLCPVSADVEAQARDAASVAVQHSGEYAQNVNMEILDGSAGTIAVFAGSEDFSLAIENAGGNVRICTRYPQYEEGGRYRHTEGNGQSRLQVSVDGGSFDLAYSATGYQEP